MALQLDFSKIEASVDKLVTSVDKLERRLDNVASSANALNKAFGSTKQFDRFVESILKLNGVSATNFTVIAKGISSIVNAINSAPSGGSTKFLSDIRRIVESLNDLKTTKASQERLAKYFDSVLKTLETVSKRLNTITLSSNALDAIGAIRKLFKQISTITTTLTATSPTAAGNWLKQFFDEIILSTNSITANTTKIDSLLNAGTVLRKVAFSINSFGQLATSFPAAKKGGSPAIKQSLESFTGIFDSLSKAVEKTKSIETIGSLSRSLQKMSSFLNTFKSLNLDQFQSGFGERAPGIIGTFFRGIRNVFDPSQLRLVSNGLKFFAKNFEGISIPQNIGSSFIGIGRFINSLKNLDVSAIQSNKAQRLPGILGKFFVGAQSFLNPTVLQKVARSLKQFAVAFKGISFPTGVGATFKGFGDFIRSVNRANIADFKPVAASRIPVIGGFLDNLSNLFKPTRFKLIGAALGSFSKIFKNFKNVDLSGLGSLFTGLAQLVSPENATNFKQDKLKGFVDFTKIVADGLNNFGKVKVDAGKLSAIGKALTGLASFKNGSGINFGNIDVKTIGTSAISNVIQLVLGQVAFVALDKIKTFVKNLLTFDSKISGALKSIGQAIHTFGTQAEAAGKNLLVNFGLDKLANNPATQIAADFDHLSNAVKVFGNLTETETKQAQEFADEIGIKYPLSANDALAATLDLIKAGQSLTSIKFILPAAADLASLGDVDLPTTTQALIEATNAFDFYANGVESTFNNVKVAANSLSGAADISTASLGELIAGLQNVAPAANLAGLDLQDTLAVLVQFNDAGIRGAEAGTQLRQVLSTLRSDKAKSELAALTLLTKNQGKEVNLSLANADGTLRNFGDFVHSLSATYKQLGYTQEQLLDSIGELTGVRSQQGIAVLLGQDGLSGIVDKINSMDSAAIRAAQLLNDFKGEVQQLQGSMETLQKNAFTPLINNGFRPFVHLARQVIDGILEIGKLNPVIYEFAANVLLVGSSIASLVGVTLIGIGVIAKFEGLLFNLVGTLILIPKRIFSIIAGLGSFVASGALLLTTLAALAVAVSGISLLLIGLKDVIERDIGHAGGAFRQFGVSVQYVLGRIGPFLNQVGRTLNLLFGSTIQNEVQAFGKRVADFFNRMTIGAFVLTDTLAQLGALFENFGNFIEESFGGNSTSRLAFFEDQLGKLSRFPLIKAIFGNNANPAGLRRVFRTVLNFLNNFRDASSDLLSGSVGILFGEKDATAKLHRGAAKFLSTITGVFKEISGYDLSSAITSFDEGKIGEGLQKLVGVITGKIRDFFIANRYKIVGILSDVLGFGASAAFGGAAFVLRLLGLDKGAQFFDELGQKLSDIIHGALHSLVGLLSGEVNVDSPILDGIISAITGDPGAAALNFAKEMGGIISNAIQGIPKALTDLGTTLNIGALIDFGNSLQNSNVLGGIATSLATIAGLALRDVVDVFVSIKDLVNAVIGGDLRPLVGIFAGVGALALHAGVLTALFGVIRSAFFGVALPALGLDLLANALKNLNDLLQTGDFRTFIKTTLGQVASDVASVFGIDLPPNTIFDRVKQALEGFRDNLPIVIQELGSRISDALIKIGDQIAYAYEQFRANTDESFGFASSGFGKSFNTANSFFKNTAPNASVFSILGGANIDSGALKSIARSDIDKINAALDDALKTYPNLDDIPQTLMDNIIKVLNDSDLMDQELSRLDARGIGDAFRNRMQGILNTNGVQPTLTPFGTNAPSLFPTRTEGFLDSITKQFEDSLKGYYPKGGEGFAAFHQRMLSEFLKQIGITDPAEQANIVHQLLHNPADDFAKQVFEEVASGFDNAVPKPAVTIPVQVTVTADSVNTVPMELSVRLAMTRGQSRMERLTRALVFGTPSGLTYGGGLHRITPEPRAKGGPLAPYSAYGVHDTPRPEVASFKDGTSIMFTGNSPGSMVKIPAMAGAPLANIGSLDDFLTYKASLNQDVDLSAITSDDIAAARKEIKDKTKAAKDYQKQIDRINRDISDEELDAFQKSYRLRLKFTEDESKAQEAYDHDRKNTLRDARETLLDAIRRGDGATALSTVRTTKQQLEEQKYQFDLAHNERQKQLDDALVQNEEERKQKQADYAQQLQDLQDQNKEQAEEQADADQDQQLALEAHTRSLAQTQARADAAEQVENNLRIFRAALANRSETDAFNESHNLIEAIFGNIRRGLWGIYNIGVNNGMIDPTVPPPSTGPLPPPVQPNTPPPGAPAHPSILQTYRDPSGILWIWTGNNWQRASSSPGMAAGGVFGANRAFRIHDTNRSELMTMNNGQSLFLSGRNSGRVTPLPPLTRNPPGYQPIAPNVFNIGSLFGDVSTVQDANEFIRIAANDLLPKFERIVNNANRGNRSNNLLNIGRGKR